MRRPRLDNWAKGMREVLALHRAAPFAWGRSDCSMFADVVWVMTGFDPIKAIRGYDSERSAYRALKAAGYDTTLDLVTECFTPIVGTEARRGDLGYPDHIPHPLMSPAVIDGQFAYSKSPGEDWIIIPTSRLTAFFAV